MSASDTGIAEEAPARSRERAAPRSIVVRKDKTNPRRIALLVLLLFAQPPGWPLLCAGAALVLAGVGFHGWAAGYLARAGYAERESVLTVRGPYRHNRNPYYVAQIIMDLGFFLVAGLPLLYLVYFPISLAIYRKWVLKEEPFLEDEFGNEYRQLKKEVPRWRVRLTPARPRGPAQRFDWATYSMNRETHRTVSHLFLLAVFVAYYVFGNPFSQLDPLIPATLVIAAAVWFLTHDIYPLDTNEQRPVWLGIAGIAAAAGAVSAFRLPLWENWSPEVSWAAVGAGAFCGVVLAAVNAPATPLRTDKVFPRPARQWCVLAAGLGLFSCQLGGLWVALFAAIVVWAVNLSGFVQVRRLPESYFTAAGILVLFAAAAAVPVTALLT